MISMAFPFVKQLDSMQCGISCLSMICRFYGKKFPIRVLEQHCQPSKDGVSFKGIADLCEVLKLDYAAGRVSVTDLLSCPLPCILHWNQNHFVVLYKIDRKGKRFWIADPGKGKYKLTLEEFSQHWLSTCSDGMEKGVAMFIETTPEFQNFKETDLDNRRSFRFLWEYVKQYKRYFLQIILGLGVGCILQLIMPFLTQWIVDIGIRHRDIKFIWLVLLGELMIVVGRTATDFVRRWLLLHISMRINISIVSDFFIKLLKLPMSFFETKLLGDLLQRMGDHSRIQNFLTNQVLGIMFTLLSFLIFGVILLFYDRVVFCIFLCGSIVYGLWIIRFLNHRKVLDYQLFEQQAISQNVTYQFITNIPEIKLQDCKRRRRWEWEDTQADLFEVQMKSIKLQQTQEAGSVFINEIKNILITVFAATGVINGNLTLGAMLAIQYIVGQLNSPVEQLMQFIYSLQDVKISLERINEIHESNNEESRSNQRQEFPGKPDIVFENVGFKYDKHSSRYTLSDISFKIPEGKVTAIVGASGSGKTTLIKLMLGYYPVLHGRINIADETIDTYDLQWWRKRCGVVMQDGAIFSESIARNIAIDDEEIDIERLENAAKTACIHDFIMGLPLKYNTLIGRDGIGLSQGQKQRILIARAVYKNPEFIFLDEATNSLDAKNEREIVENLEDFYYGKTVVIVAHRLSTVKNADNIIVLESGKIVEIGTHKELLKKEGTYYNLIKNQLELGN